jgi:hypothetical protein
MGAIALGMTQGTLQKHLATMPERNLDARVRTGTIQGLNLLPYGLHCPRVNADRARRSFKLVVNLSNAIKVLGNPAALE